MHRTKYDLECVRRVFLSTPREQSELHNKKRILETHPAKETRLVILVSLERKKKEALKRDSPSE